MTKFVVKQLLKRIFKIFSWVLYAVTLLAAYGGYMNPENWTVPSMAVLFFPYLAMSTLVVGGFWLIKRRYVIGSCGIGVLMLCGPTFAEALPFRFGHSASNPDRTFKIITFNCLHFYDIKNPKAPENRSIDFIINSGADFVCLQELYTLQKEVPKRYSAQVDSLKKVYPYMSDDNKREVEFFSKYPFEQMEVKLGNDVRYGSVAAYKIHIDNEDLTIINVHLSSYLLSTNERKIFTQANSKGGVKKSIKELEGSVYQKMKNAFRLRAKVSQAISDYAASLKGNVIVCGDFNDVPGSWSYRCFTKNGFEDAYSQTGMGHLITYNQHLMWFHIDQILYRGDLVPLYVTKERLSASDHYPLIAEFEFL